MFGRLGDTLGRKYTFIITIVFMGFATFTIGLIPGFAQIGWLSPAMLVFLRIVQGLAIGGEYAGAAIYVAEFVDAKRRGMHDGMDTDHADNRSGSGNSGLHLASGSM